MKNKKLVVIVSLLLVVCVCLVLTACDKNPKPTQLASPQISLDEATGTVSWKKVEHADSYDVKVNSNAAINVKTTSYTFPSETAEGSYEVTVIAKSSNTDKYSASNPSNKVTFVKESGGSGEKALTQLSRLHLPTKYEYFLDEGATELDLTGAQFRAHYSDGSHKDLGPNDVSIGSYTMPVGSGDLDVTVSYTENGVTKETTLTFTIRVRTEDDIDVNGVEIITNSVEDSTYVVANIEATQVVKMNGAPLTISTAEGKTTVAATELTDQGRHLLAVTDSQGNKELVVVVVGTIIENTVQFKAIANDLAATAGQYYIITRDLDFGNYWQSPIGLAPITCEAVDPETTSDPDNPDIQLPDTVGGAVGTGSSSHGDQNQEGVAFLGTIDGLGHTIMNYPINKEAKWRVDAHALAMFGWLGNGAKICNLNLRNVSIGGGRHAAILVGINEGTIENVSIEESCTLVSSINCGAAIAGYNFGTIKNVVSLMTSYNGSTPVELAYTLDGEPYAAIANGFIGNGDHTSVLGGGWRYFEGVGTLYVTPSFVHLNKTESELAISEDELELSVIMQENDPSNVEVNFFGANASLLTYEWRAGKLYVKLANYGAPNHPSGIEIPMSVSGSGTLATFVVKIVPARITGYDLLNDANQVVSELPMNITEGMDIVLGSINIRKNMSDGTSSILHPTRLVDFDKNGTVGVVQTVKAFYGEGENDYVTLKVTLIAKTVTSIVMASQPTNASYTIGTDSALDLAGATITVNYNNGTNETIPVTSAMIDADSYNLTTAGAYNVQVTYGGQSCTFPITVNDAAATVTSIAIVGTPAKGTYKISETVSAATDLNGATITATLSKGEPMTGIAITDTMISGGYNFSTAGTKDITVTYEGKTATISVTVVDYATALNVAALTSLDCVNDIPQISYSKANALDLKAVASFTLTMKSGATVNVTGEELSKISASEAEAGEHEITYTFTDTYATVTAKQTYGIWYEISAANKDEAVEEWTVMQSNLAGYFRLTKDLDFGETKVLPIGETKVLPIGKQPINSANDESSCNCDPATANIQVGVPFTGKFDGQGFAIKYIKLDGWGGFDGETFGLSLFGYIGATGEVKNLIVKNSSFTSYNQTGFIATINEGLVENIVIDSTCSIKANWGTAGIVVFNYGTGVLRNAVSYVTTVAKGTGSASLGQTAANYGTIEKCYVANEEDFLTNSAALGDVDGWTFIADYGPYYGNNYAILVSAADTVALNGEWTFKLALGQGHNIVNLYVKSGGNKEWYGWKKGDDGITFTIKVSAALQESFAVGNTYSFAIRTDMGCLPGVNVTITPAISDPAQEGL